MKRTRISICILSFILSSHVLYAKYSGGSGTASEPYLISNPSDMVLLSQTSGDWFGKYFKVTNDIDFSGVGNMPSIGYYFDSVFDGNMKCFKNLTFNKSGTEGGIFQVTGFSSVIKNLRIENATATFTPTGEEAHFGILVGENSGRVENCQVSGRIRTNTSYMMLAVSCVVGFNFYDGQISKCSAIADIDVVSGGFGRAAAVAGMNDGYMSECAASGVVKCQSSSIASAGGLVAENDGDIYFSSSDTNVSSIASPGLSGGVVAWNAGLISNCYSFNGVKTNDDGGGIVGYNQGDIEYCYSAAKIVGVGSTDIGGVVGEHDAGVITACLWDKQASGVLVGVGWNDSGNSPDVYGMNTAQMKISGTFMSKKWDFIGESSNGTGDFWRLCVDGVSYPKLGWEYVSGDLACPDGVDLSDFDVFSANWLRHENDFLWYDNADINNDGSTDIMDLLLLCENWMIDH